MKKIIKNILLILTVFISFNLAGDVKAVETLNTQKLQFSYASSSFSVSIRKFSIPSLSGSSHVYLARIGGKTAACIDFGIPANSGDSYYSDGTIYSANTMVRRAYNTLLSSNMVLHAIVAQDIIWHNGNVSRSTLITDLIAARKSQLSAVGVGSTLDREIAGAIVDVVLKKSPYNGTLYIWGSTTAGRQRFITNLKPVIEEKIYKCDDGTMEETITACVNSLTNGGYDETSALNSCKTKYCKVEDIPEVVNKCTNGSMNKTGNIPACTDNNQTVQANFSYTPTTGNDKTVHSLYGEYEEVAGLSQYCKLYCTETGTVILPGGFGNALTSGTNVIWPTSSNTLSTTFGNVYPLKFSGTKTCHLAIEDKNAPEGSSINGDCNLTPLENYQEYYNKTSSLARQTDIDGRNYESVRIYEAINRGGSYYVDTNYCGDLGTLTNASHGNAQYYVKNSSGYYTKYSSNTETLRSNLQSSAIDYDNKQYAADTYSPKTEQRWECKSNCSCTSTITHSCNKEYGYVTYETDGYKEAKQKASEAKEKYQNAKSNYESRVGNSINYCKQYITYFNATRNLANEISLCYNYVPTGCDGSSECSIYNFNASANYNFEDSEYSQSDAVKQVNDVNYSCVGCTVASKMNNYSNTYTYNSTNRLYNVNEMANKIAKIQGRTITVTTNNVEFELNSQYKYIDKKTNKPLTTSNENSIDVGYSFLPLSYENEIGRSYEISLNNINFGHTSGSGSRFEGKTINNGDYVCHYTVNGTNDDCLCPVGTENAGEDLFYITKSENIACETAKLKYCDVKGTDFDDGDKADKYCPNDMSKKITACLNSGYSYDYCVNLICDDKVNSKYTCKNTNGVGGKMDITSCVYTKYSQGYSLNDAIDECDALVCPISGGIKIIYRTISLENPFPGKNIAKQVSGFNQDVKGRYPGTNWNSLDLVKNEILYNRGVSGSSVYKEEPLYTFVLTTDTIKRIRTYNDTRNSADGYADFTLDCKNKNSTACVSSFVHNRDYGLTSGTCASATSKNNFYTCSK